MEKMTAQQIKDCERELVRSTGLRGVYHRYAGKVHELGQAKITTIEYNANPSYDLQNLRYLRDGAGFMRMVNGAYARLHLDGELMMSDTRMERVTNYEFVKNAKGRVFIGGLGIGLLLENILDNGIVNEVVVVENNADLIALVGPLFKHPKLTIVEGDVFTYKPSGKFDTIYFDIWAKISQDNLPDMAKLHQRYKGYKRSKSAYMGSWLRPYLVRERNKEQRANYGWGSRAFAL
jgi:hypothetical protein